MLAFQNLDDIFALLQKWRGRLCARVGQLSEATVRRKPNPEAWSIAEIVEHLALTEQVSVRIITEMLPEAEASEGEAFPLDVTPFLALDPNARLRAPEIVRPQGVRPLAELLDDLQQSRAALLALRPRLSRANVAAASRPHPVFGPITLGQRLVFIGLHEARHLRQIEDVLEEVAREGQA